MISSETDYQKAREEVEHLSRWLARLETREGAEFKGLTAASIRRMIARVQEEIAEYEAGRLSFPLSSQKKAKPDATGADPAH